VDRPKCSRCHRPLVLMPSFDEPGDYELSCSGGWTAGVQDDTAFQTAWDNLPGDWVVRLEKELGVA
jgi:hypothetical protein